MSGLWVWWKQDVITRNSVVVCVCMCVREIVKDSSVSVLASVLSTSRVAQQVSTGLLVPHRWIKNSLHKKMRDCFCVPSRLLYTTSKNREGYVSTWPEVPKESEEFNKVRWAVSVPNVWKFVDLKRNMMGFVRLPCPSSSLSICPFIRTEFKGSYLAYSMSSHQVLLKSVQSFLCNPAN